MKLNENSLASDTTINNRYSFALCEECFWSATILKEIKDEEHQEDVGACPVCRESNNIAIIPLEKNECYQINLSPKSGLELSFFTKKILA
jgi:hypothetical protein